MPPLPKDPSTRQRRNKVSTGATLRLVDKPKVPVLPKRATGLKWHPEAVAWWKSAWSSPMVQEWTEADKGLVLMCLAARHSYWEAFDEGDRRGLPTLMNSVVAAEKMLGLSPMARRSLQWQIEQAESAEEKTEARRKARASARVKPSAVPSVDPREMLA